MVIHARSAYCLILSAAISFTALTQPAKSVEIIPAGATVTTKTSVEHDVNGKLKDVKTVETTKKTMAAAVVVPPSEEVVVNQRPSTCAQLQQVTSTYDTVFTGISNNVKAQLPPLPVVAAPVDTLKLQLMNRMNSALISGAFSNEEVDEYQARLDDLARQEAEFKIADGACLSQSAVNNLMRKYIMLGQDMDRTLRTTQVIATMPSFENHRAGLQRLISYHGAAGNLTPAETEQLLTALSIISDNYAGFAATGGTVTADELEQSHRDLFKLQRRVGELVGGQIIVVNPESRPRREQLLEHIQAGIASRLLTPKEGDALMCRYNDIVRTESAIIADEGVRSMDIKRLADQISSLDFVITREINDRALASKRTEAVAGESLKF